MDAHTPPHDTDGHATPPRERKGCGGPQPNSGRKVGAPKQLPPDENKKTMKAVSAHYSKLNIAEEYENVTPLECLLMAMRHYMTACEWSAAASCAEKAAKYVHSPKSAIAGRDNDLAATVGGLADGQLKLITSNDGDEIRPRKRAA